MNPCEHVCDLADLVYDDDQITCTDCGRHWDRRSKWFVSCTAVPGSEILSCFHDGSCDRASAARMVAADKERNSRRRFARKTEVREALSEKVGPVVARVVQQDSLF